MDLDALRQAVWEANTSLPKAGLVKWAQGNASGRDPKSGLVAIKPSGARLDKLQPDDIVIVDLDGKVVQGHLKPSIDTASHLYVYRQRDDVHGIVHTHSPCATSFALRGEPIPVCSTTAAALFGAAIPVSDFATIGEEAIGEQIVAKIGALERDPDAQPRGVHDRPHADGSLQVCDLCRGRGRDPASGAASGRRDAAGCDRC